jgi:lipoprotein-releasing system permease protein
MNLRAAAYLGVHFLFGRGRGAKTSRHLWGAVLGIAFSLVPLFVVIQVSGGMIEGITRRYIEIGSYHLQIRPVNTVENEELRRAAGEVETVSGVESAFPFVRGEGLLYTRAGRTGVSVKGLPQEYWERDPQVRRFLTIHAGSFDLNADGNVLLSREVAQKLEAEVGDRVRLLTARRMPGREPILRPTGFTVTGIFSTGYYELDALSAYIPFEEARSLYRTEGSSGLGVKVDQPYGGMEAMKRRVEEILPPHWNAYSWYDLEKTMLESFKTTRNLLIFIMVLIVIVAAVNISSSLIMLVMEKEPEIAILKSTGSSPRMIVFSFMCTGLAIGFLGTVLGSILGMAAAVQINGVLRGLEVLLQLGTRGIVGLLAPIVAVDTPQIELLSESYYLEQIPITIGGGEIFLTVFFALFISAAASYTPAVRAGRMKPLEILRKH